MAQDFEEKMELKSKVDGMGGVWLSEGAMDEWLQHAKQSARGEGKKVQSDAIKTQMNFRKLVMQQKAEDAKDWTFSCNGRPLDVEGLKQKLRKLIAMTRSR